MSSISGDSISTRTTESALSYNGFADHGHIEGSGYRTPMEEREIPFFANARNPSSSSMHLDLPAIRQVRSAPSATHDGLEEVESVMVRPAMNGNASAPDTAQLERQRTASTRRRRRADTSASLGQAVSKSEGMPEDCVTIKDRIACYRWTFFTMVCSSSTSPNGSQGSSDMSIDNGHRWYGQRSALPYALTACLSLVVLN